MPISRANGLDIHYEKAGSGPAFVMLHPLPYDLNCWLFQVAHFSSRFTTLAIDMRGWGQSDKPTKAFTWRDMCDDIMGVLADQGFAKDVVVMGCSCGSKIALTLGIDHPDVFSAVILAGGNSSAQPWLEPHMNAARDHAAAGTLMTYHRDSLLRGVLKSWAETPLGTYLIDGFVERGGNLNAESIVRVFEVLISSDLTPSLATFKTPLLIINGEHDSAFPGGARTASLVPGAERRILPDASHCSFLEDPNAFDAAVQEFLSSKRLWPAAANERQA